MKKGRQKLGDWTKRMEMRGRKLRQEGLREEGKDIYLVKQRWVIQLVGIQFIHYQWRTGSKDDVPISGWEGRTRGCF